MAGLECPICRRPVKKRKSGMHKACEKRLKKARKNTVLPTFGTGQST
jgi:hypothetical protein